VVTSTTHKSLRGPRGGMILSDAEFAKAIDSAVFPGSQGGPLMHAIAAKAVCFGEALKPSFRVYAAQVVANAKVLADRLQERGLRLVSGGTDNHLMLIDLRPKGLKGRQVQDVADTVGITVNRNSIPFDEGSKFNPSGVRLGTPSVTTRGMGPEEMREIFGEAWPEWSDEDMRLIKQPIDFLGVNYYTRRVERDYPENLPLRTKHVPQPQHIETDTKWEVFPEALTKILLWATERYGKPAIYITENGAAFYDPPHTIDGRVEDPLRVEYFRQHLRAAHEAMKKGANLRGYYAWSLLDNYEWAHGYSKRFGIVHVDYSTQQRTIKSSGRYYAEVIRTKGASLTK